MVNGLGEQNSEDEFQFRFLEEYLDQNFDMDLIKLKRPPQTPKKFNLKSVGAIGTFSNLHK